MRSVIMIVMGVLAAGVAQAQVQGQATSAGAQPNSPKAELQLTTTNNVHRPLRHPNLVYSGVAVQAAKTRNPLQLVNPFAPASYGSPHANTVSDPVTGRPDGLKLFSIAFW